MRLDLVVLFTTIKRGLRCSLIHSIHNGSKSNKLEEADISSKVVKERLDECKIGQFCLNLHDFKANRKELYKEIDNTWHIGPFNTNDTQIKNDLDLLIATRKKLNNYVGNQWLGGHHSGPLDVRFYG